MAKIREEVCPRCKNTNGEHKPGYPCFVKAAQEHAKRLEFASKLALLKEEAGRLGLFYTMQMLEAPLTMVGFEIAGTPELYEKHRKN